MARVVDEDISMPPASSYSAQGHRLRCVRLQGFADSCASLQQLSMLAILPFWFLPFPPPTCCFRLMATPHLKLLI